MTGFDKKVSTHFFWRGVVAESDSIDWQSLKVLIDSKSKESPKKKFALSKTLNSNYKRDQCCFGVGLYDLKGG